MAKISIVRPHTLGIAGARQAIERVGEDLAAKHQINHAWHGDTLKVQRSGVDGSLEVLEDAVRIDLNLGFAASLFKGTIEQAIQAELDRQLG